MNNVNVKMVTPLAEIDALLRKEAERVEELTIRALARLGEMCVTEARDRPSMTSWIDQTGNLRSSIGYVIVRDGEIISLSDFRQVNNGREGVESGKELATELAKAYSTGYALIVVAGMRYAVFVEAMENKVVLSSAELFARNELPKMLAKLKQQISV